MLQVGASGDGMRGGNQIAPLPEPFGKIVVRRSYTTWHWYNETNRKNEKQPKVLAIRLNVKPYII